MPDNAIDKPRWRDIAEAIGVTAIVASLVFVGMQLRQDVRNATSDAVGDALEAQIEVAQLISSHSALIEKANLGEPISYAEELVLREIARVLFAQVLFQIWQFAEIGDNYSSSPEQYLAAYLFQNPGMRVAFTKLSESTTHLVDPLRSPESLARTYQTGSRAMIARVNNYLTKLDSLNEGDFQSSQ